MRSFKENRATSIILSSKRQKTREEAQRTGRQEEERKKEKKNIPKPLKEHVDGNQNLEQFPLASENFLRLLDLAAV